MSLETITLNAARVAALAPLVQVVYALEGSTEFNIAPYPADVADSPAVRVSHTRFEVDPSSFEITRHFIALDVFLRASEPQAAEVLAVRVVDQIREAFRTNVYLLGALDAPGSAGFALIIDGGPINDQDVNGQPFVVYPMTLRATEGQPQTYLGG